MEKKSRKSGTGLRLTDRDKQIIVTVYKLKYLKQGQIRRLFYSTPQKARARLKYLYDIGLLDRFRPPINFGKGTTQYIYSLSIDSAKFISRFLGEEKVNWKKRYKLIEQMFLDHTLLSS